MDFIERMIAAAAPKWAAERAYYRSVWTASRAYEAAKTGRRTDGWVATGSSANAEIGPALNRLRSRSRDLGRNNPWIARAFRLLPGHIVGAGIVPLFAGADKAAKQRQRDDWNRFSDACDPEGLSDFYGVQHLTARAVVESGEALVQWLPRPSSWNLKVPLQCRVLEPDHLDTGKTEALSTGGVVIQGVEYDAHGRRVAYWLFDQHPGEALPSIRRKYVSTRVDAQWLDHVFERVRPGQVRGVPWTAPIALRVRDTDDYEDALQVKKKIEACFVMAVTSAPGQASSPLGQTTVDDKSRTVEKISPGLIYHATGGDVKFGQPSSSQGEAEYLIWQAHAAAAGIGCTYQQMTGDNRQANYSSMRAGRLEFWVMLDAWQWHMMAPQCCAPAARRVGALLAALGRGDWRPAEWAMPFREKVDPDKDSKAELRELRTGSTHLARVLGGRGYDLDDHLDRIKEINDGLDARGIVLDSDPRQVSAAGLTQARPDGTKLPDTAGTDEGDDKDENPEDDE